MLKGPCSPRQYDLVTLTSSLSLPPTCFLPCVPQLRAMASHRNGNLSEMPLQEFMLEGYEGGLQTQALLFALFLALYVVAVLGNLTMIVVITLDAHLHSPMYFFLKNLSFLDLCYSSVIAPKALVNFLSSSKVKIGRAHV